MIKKFTIDDENYYFNTQNLKLYKDKVVKTQEESSFFQKDKSILYKLVFNVSNTCNLNCRYCYASCGNYGRNNSLMSQKKADNIIENLVKKFNEIRTVYFFGGEPTINFNLIKHIVKLLNKNFKICDYRIVSNGCLINEEMIKFFSENNFKVYISIDGPKKINDHLRGDYFNKLINVINLLKKSPIKDNLELICTYTKYHQENISFDQLENFFDELKVRYSISDVITNDKKLKIKKSQKEIIRQEIDFIDKSFERIINKSLNVGISAYLRNVIDALIYKNKTDCFCKELEDNYSHVYDYNGDVYSCVRLLGTHKINDESIKQNNSKNREACNRCWAKNICRDCVADVILKNCKAPYLSNSCYKKALYRYTLFKIIKLYHEDINLFNTMISNFYSYYLF